MNVGLLIYGSLETLSGGYLYDRKLVEHLERQGDRVEIISLPWRSYAHHLVDNLSTSLMRRLEGLRVDVLLQDELNHPSLFVLNHRLRPRVGYPIFSIVHHLRSSEHRPGWQNAFYRLVERRYLRSLDGFIYNSQTTRGVVESLVGSSRPGLVAYPAGDRLVHLVSIGDDATRWQQPGPLRLVFVGNLIPRKGLHTLLEALAKLPAELWRLDVVGRGDADARYALKLLQRASLPDLQPGVRFLGALADQDLANSFRESHLMVAPSSYEGFGIVYLEAMSFGLPAVGTTAGAAAEIITPGENGALVAPDDVDALSRVIRELANDRDRLELLSQAARRRFAAHPTWDETTGAIRQFLLNVIQPAQEG